MSPRTGAATSSTPDPVQSQINALGEAMQNGFNEIKSLLQGIDNRVREIETREAGCYPLVNLKLAGLDAKVNQHETEIEALKKLVTALAQMKTIMTWALGIFTAVLISLLIALATGKAQILFH